MKNPPNAHQCGAGYRFLTGQHAVAFHACVLPALPRPDHRSDHRGNVPYRCGSGRLRRCPRSVPRFWTEYGSPPVSRHHTHDRLPGSDHRRLAETAADSGSFPGYGGWFVCTAGDPLVPGLPVRPGLWMNSECGTGSRRDQWLVP